MGDMAIRLRKMTSRSFRGVNRGTVMTTAPFLQRRIQTGGILQTRARGCRTRPRNASPLPYRAPFRRLLTMRKGPKERPDAALYSRSEEHTSELQSREKLVCRLLLEKKKDNNRD